MWSINLKDYLNNLNNFKKKKLEYFYSLLLSFPPFPPSLSSPPLLLSHFQPSSYFVFSHLIKLFENKKKKNNLLGKRNAKTSSFWKFNVLQTLLLFNYTKNIINGISGTLYKRFLFYLNFFEEERKVLTDELKIPAFERGAKMYEREREIDR